MWLTDVTYVWTPEGWLYLAVILDLFSRRVVGWSASANNDRTLALSALNRATMARAPAPGLVHHSDRGSVYASVDYDDALNQLGAVKSMSRKGDCWDNAVPESFFATIKGKMMDHQDYATKSAAIAAIPDYIDVFYNTCRRHSALDYVSPIEFELKFMSEKIAKMAASSDRPRDPGELSRRSRTPRLSGARATRRSRPVGGTSCHSSRPFSSFRRS